MTTALPLSAVGGACADAKAKSVSELDAYIEELAALSKVLGKRGDSFNLGTPAFYNAKQHVESAWRNLQFARQQFDL